MPCIDEGFSRFGKSDWFSIRGFPGDTIHEVRFKKEVMDLTMDSPSPYSLLPARRASLTSLRSNSGNRRFANGSGNGSMVRDRFPVLFLSCYLHVIMGPGLIKISL